MGIRQLFPVPPGTLSRFLLSFLLLLLLAACAGSPAGSGESLSLDEAVERSAGDIAGKLPAGTRVAIVAFESPHLNLSDYIMDEITGFLVDGSLEVADRNNLEYVYRELNFQMSGNVSDETALGVGKFLGVRYVITGQFIDAGDAWRWRLNGINVETARHESSTRLYVRKDRSLKRLLAALQDAAPAVRTASYGTGAAAPGPAGAFLDRGIASAGRGDYDAAIADFTQAVTLDPTLTAAWVLRGRALVASVSRVTGVGENFSGITIMMSTGGRVSEEQKAVYDRAIADFSQAITLDPDNKDAYKERGRAYAHKGDPDKAIADFNQAIRLDPKYTAAYANRGDAWRGKGDLDKAIADYTQAITLDPKSAAMYNGRGTIWRGKGDLDKAMADYNEAIRLDPKYAMAYNNRGNAWWGKGDLDKAIADYTQAIRLDPKYATAYLNRGIAWGGKGDYARARADYEKALQLDPGNDQARDNLERLRGMSY
jgi:tetratricopeptide (TPR) repeat protein